MMGELQTGLGLAGPIEQSLRDYEINDKLRLRQRDLMNGKW